MKDKDLHQKRCTAYHEAGHAVAATWLGIRFKSVNIITLEDDNQAGELVGCASGDETAKQARLQLIVAFAGAVAESLVSTRPQRPFMNDEMIISENAAVIVGDFPEERGQIRAWRDAMDNAKSKANAQTIRLFERPAARRALQMVAGSLFELESLSESEVLAMVRASKRST